jgi:hypothetical protein
LAEIEGSWPPPHPIAGELRSTNCILSPHPSDQINYVLQTKEKLEFSNDYIGDGSWGTTFHPNTTLDNVNHIYLSNKIGKIVILNQVVGDILIL